MYLMQPYDDALQEILDHGIIKQDRTGVGTVGVAGLQKKYRLDTDFFPIVTGRRLYPKSVFAELLWIISGSTYNKDLIALGAKFWGKWCDEANPKYVALRNKWGYRPGDFGPIYGWQLRHFGADYIAVTRLRHQLQDHLANQYAWDQNILDIRTIYPDRDLIETSITMTRHNITNELNKGTDQLSWMVDVLKNNPFGSDGRRCLFSLWNPCDYQKMALPPCHYTYQAIADGERGLTGILTQRSCDFPVGVPANIQFYSALTIMLAQQANLKPRELIHNTNDSHIYLNQIEQTKEYLSRSKPDSPKLSINKAADIFSYQMSDFVLTDYNPADKIDVPVSV